MFKKIRQLMKDSENSEQFMHFLDWLLGETKAKKFKEKLLEEGCSQNNNIGNKSRLSELYKTMNNQITKKKSVSKKDRSITKPEVLNPKKSQKRRKPTGSPGKENLSTNLASKKNSKANSISEKFKPKRQRSKSHNKILTKRSNDLIIEHESKPSGRLSVKDEVKREKEGIKNQKQKSISMRDKFIKVIDIPKKTHTGRISRSKTPKSNNEKPQKKNIKKSKMNNKGDKKSKPIVIPSIMETPSLQIDNFLAEKLEISAEKKSIEISDFQSNQKSEFSDIGIEIFSQAATFIQKVWRGYRTRLMLQIYLAQYLEELSNLEEEEMINSKKEKKDKKKKSKILELDFNSPNGKEDISSIKHDSDFERDVNISNLSKSHISTIQKDIENEIESNIMEYFTPPVEKKVVKEFIYNDSLSFSSNLSKAIVSSSEKKEIYLIESLEIIKRESTAELLRNRVNKELDGLDEILRVSNEFKEKHSSAKKKKKKMILEKYSKTYEEKYVQVNSSTSPKNVSDYLTESAERIILKEKLKVEEKEEETKNPDDYFKIDIPEGISQKPANFFQNKFTSKTGNLKSLEDQLSPKLNTEFGIKKKQPQDITKVEKKDQERPKSPKYVSNLNVNSSEEERKIYEDFELTEKLLKQAEDLLKEASEEEENLESKADQLTIEIFDSLIKEVATEYSNDEVKTILEQKSIEQNLEVEENDVLTYRKVKGIKNSLLFIKDYVNLLIQYLNEQHRDFVIEKINQPSDFDQKSYLKRMRTIENALANNIELNLESLRLYKDTVLTIDIFNELENRSTGNSFNKKSKLDSEKEEREIIFFAFSEALEFFGYEKIFNSKAIWRTSIKPRNVVNESNFKKLLEKAKDKVLEWASSLCGFFPEKDDSIIGDDMEIDEDYTAQIREERMIRMINLDILEDEEKWNVYSDQVCAISMEVTDFLIDHLISEIKEEWK